MADENKNALQRGVVVEFDFTAIDGSQLLFETAKKVLKGHGVDLTVKLEAMRLVGGNYQGGLSELFEFLGSKADAAKVAQELAEAFRAALGTQAVQAVTPEFKAFVKALVDKGVKVVVATRSDVEPLKAALAGIGGVVGKDEDASNELRACEFSRVKGGKPFNVRNSRFRNLLNEIGQGKVRKTRVVVKK